MDEFALRVRLYTKSFVNCLHFGICTASGVKRELLFALVTEFKDLLQITKRSRIRNF